MTLESRHGKPWYRRITKAGNYLQVSTEIFILTGGWSPLQAISGAGASPGCPCIYRAPYARNYLQFRKKIIAHNF